MNAHDRSAHDQSPRPDAGNADADRTDANTTIAVLRDLVERFVTDRDWHQFHSPKNLSMALAIEAAELMEHFQWIDTAASRGISGDAKKLAEVGEELADVLCYAVALANELGLDIATTMRRKMVKNVKKYPAAEFRGRYGRDDKRQDASPSGDAT